MEVFAAIESAAELRWMLEHADVADPTERAWVGHEVELLEHWADLLVEGDYAAVGEGLASFAHHCRHVLICAEHDGGRDPFR